MTKLKRKRDRPRRANTYLSRRGAAKAFFKGAGYEPSFPTPGWIDELSPAQRAVISARESGEVDREPRPIPSIHGKEFSGAAAAGIDLHEVRWLRFVLDAAAAAAANIYRGVACTMRHVLD
eukprot:COSAG05_NODE_4367_length_1548_cov_4.889579_2_plen_121_part_00